MAQAIDMEWYAKNAMVTMVNMPHPCKISFSEQIDHFNSNQIIDWQFIFIAFSGMVSQEEYEYSAFKCAFCKALNPAKKIRPIAPRLAIPEKSATEPSKSSNQQPQQPQPNQSPKPRTAAPAADKDSSNLS